MKDLILGAGPYFGADAQKDKILVTHDGQYFWPEASSEAQAHARHIKSEVKIIYRSQYKEAVEPEVYDPELLAEAEAMLDEKLREIGGTEPEAPAEKPKSRKPKNKA